MKHRVSLEDRQQEMMERIRLRKQGIKRVPPSRHRWLEKHFTEIMERLIDDLGLDVPRREPKLTALSS